MARKTKKLPLRSKSKRRAKKGKKTPLLLIADHHLKIYVVSLVLMVLLCGAAIVNVLAASYPAWKSIPNPPRVAKGSIKAEDGSTTTVSGCKKVLVVGDSIAKGMAYDPSKPADPNSYKGQNGAKLQKQMAQLGYCATVFNEAISGSSACHWTNLGWFDNALAKHPDAQLIVSHFVGNEPGCMTQINGVSTQIKWTEPFGTWLPAYQQATQTLQAKASAKNLPMYWVIPAPAYRACYPPNQLYVSSLWRAWAHWQEGYWPADRQINFRKNWGGDTYIPTFRFSNGLPASVRTDTVKGQKDCLHFTDFGYNLMSNAVRAVIYKEWLKQ